MLRKVLKNFIRIKNQTKHFSNIATFSSLSRYSINFKPKFYFSEDNNHNIDEQRVESLLYNFNREIKLTKKMSTKFTIGNQNIVKMEAAEFKGKLGVDPDHLELYQLEVPEIRKNSDKSINYPSYSWTRLRFPFEEKPEIR